MGNANEALASIQPTLDITANLHDEILQTSQGTQTMNQAVGLAKDAIHLGADLLEDDLFLNPISIVRTVEDTFTLGKDLFNLGRGLFQRPHNHIPLDSVYGDQQQQHKPLEDLYNPKANDGRALSDINHIPGTNTEDYMNRYHVHPKRGIHQNIGAILTEKMSDPHVIHPTLSPRDQMFRIPNILKPNRKRGPPGSMAREPKRRNIQPMGRSHLPYTFENTTPMITPMTRQHVDGTPISMVPRSIGSDRANQDIHEGHAYGHNFFPSGMMDHGAAAMHTSVRPPQIV